MTHALLNNNFHVYGVRHVGTSDEDPTEVSVLETLNSATVQQRLRKRVAKLILKEELYQTAYSGNTGSLIPLNSRLYSGGRLTSDRLELNDILRQIQLKVKDRRVDYGGITCSVGQLRLRFLDIIPVQIFIVIEPQPGQCILLCKSLPKMQGLLASFLVNQMGCTVEPLRIPDSFLGSTLDESVRKRHKLGAVELTFNVRTHSGALTTAVLNVEPRDVTKFAGKKGFLASLCDYMKRETSVDFSRLPLSRIRTELFLLGSDGRLRFSDLMSHLPDPEAHGDTRPSVWTVLQRMCELNK